MHKVYVHDGGGAGDIVRNQIQRRKGWGYIELFKKRFPTSEILAITTAVSNQGAEFLKYNPYIDKIKELPWANPNLPWKDLAKHTIGYKFIGKAVKELLPKAKPIVPPVYLSPEDKQVTQEIQKAGKYIFIHPFAGTRERIVYPIEKYPDLIDTIIDELGYNVAITGGTHLRLTNQGLPDTMLNEEFKYERKGLFNLVGKSNMRVGSHLARNASFYMGTLSCYSPCRFIKEPAIIPAIIFVPAQYYLQAQVLNKDLQKLVRISMGAKNISDYKKIAIRHIKEKQ